MVTKECIKDNSLYNSYTYNKYDRRVCLADSFIELKGGLK